MHFEISLDIIYRSFTVSGKLKPEEAVQATLSSLPDEVVDTIQVTSLPSEDSVSERRRKLEFLEMQEELIKVKDGNALLLILVLFEVIFVALGWYSRNYSAYSVCYFLWFIWEEWRIYWKVSVTKKESFQYFFFWQTSFLVWLVSLINKVLGVSKSTDKLESTSFLLADFVF